MKKIMSILFWIDIFMVFIFPWVAMAICYQTHDNDLILIFSIIILFFILLGTFCFVGPKTIKDTEQ